MPTCDKGRDGESMIACISYYNIIESKGNVKSKDKNINKKVETLD